MKSTMKLRGLLAVLVLALAACSPAGSGRKSSDSGATPAADVPSSPDTAGTPDAGGNDDDATVEDTAPDPTTGGPEDTTTTDTGGSEDTATTDTGGPDTADTSTDDAGCQADCAGKACGEDGCGGSCGSCEDGETCLSGVCHEPPPCSEAPDCECVLAECDVPLPAALACGALGGSPDCAALILSDYVENGCGACGELTLPGLEALCGDPACAPIKQALSGVLDLEPACEACVCQPDCAGMECGSDGCGGSCGECGVGEQCVDGGCGAAPECFEAPTCECLFDLCAPDSEIAGLACQALSASPDCEALVLDNVQAVGACGDTCEGLPTAALDVICAAPACESFVGLLGTTCASCSCTPDCTEKACGDDGCGGSCGECAAGLACVEGACEGVQPCFAAPTCECLFEECAPESPLAAVACSAFDTAPECKALVLANVQSVGSCGESCEGLPTTALDVICTAPACQSFVGLLGTACTDCACAPACADKVCGDDGCGGSCGDCAEGQQCLEGQCTTVELECASAGAGNVSCSDDPATSCSCVGCNTDGTCAPVDDDCVCPDCAEDAFCAAATSCNSDGVCDPYNEGCVCGDCAAHPVCGDCVANCDGKTCGPDGCGGSCGTCLAGWSCDAGGTCQEGCVPDCAEDQQCGDDGCGATCGECPANYFCNEAASNGGQCTVDAGQPCDGVSLAGCCDGLFLKYCENDELQGAQCTNQCGWNTASSWYDCSNSGEDPTGTSPIACP